MKNCSYEYYHRNVLVVGIVRSVPIRICSQINAARKKLHDVFFLSKSSAVAASPEISFPTRKKSGDLVFERIIYEAVLVGVDTQGIRDNCIAPRKASPRGIPCLVQALLCLLG